MNQEFTVTGAKILFKIPVLGGIAITETVVNTWIVMAIIVGLRMVLKQPLLALFHGSLVSNAVRYFVMVIFAGCIWPHTFPLFAKVGARKEEKFIEKT